MSWVFEVPPDAPAGEARITWTIQYVMDALQEETYSKPDNPRKISAKVVILKDDIQAVLPIAKVSWQKESLFLLVDAFQFYAMR